jgi:RNA polymerase sigma-70 factor
VDRGELGENPEQLPLDVELAYVRGHHADDFREALRQAVAGLSREEKHLLSLHYRERLTVDQLAAALHVGRTSAFRRLAEAREVLSNRLRAILEVRLRASGRDLDSLLRAVRSGLVFTLAEDFRTCLPKGARKDRDPP